VASGEAKRENKRMLKALVNMQYLFFWNEMKSHFTEAQFLPGTMRVCPML
jgi:hypothetical protein